MSRYTESISVVFPAHNEETNIARAIEQANQVLPGLTQDWEIIVVDDGSHDRTAQVLKECQQNQENLFVLRHPINRGYGSALKSGILHAKKDLIFFSDSDLQFNLAELSDLLDWIGEFDIVVGYRRKRVDPFHRRVNAFGWNILVRLVLGLKIRDIDCAFKVFRRQVFDTVIIDAVGAMVNTDILAQAFKSGFKIKEVPVTHYPRLSGEQSGANLLVILRAFKELIRLHEKLKEMRRHSRFHVPIKFRIRDSSNGWLEQTISLSQGGMRFKTDKKYDPEQTLGIDMLHNDIGCVTLSAKVVWAAQNQQGYEVAIRFTGIRQNHKKAITRLLAIHQ